MTFEKSIHFETVGWKLVQYAEQEHTFEYSINVTTFAYLTMCCML